MNHPRNSAQAIHNEVTTVIKPKPPTLMSAVQTVLAAPAKAVGKFASLFRGGSQLRIVK